MNYYNEQDQRDARVVYDLDFGIDVPHEVIDEFRQRLDISGAPLLEYRDPDWKPTELGLRLYANVPMAPRFW